MELFKKGAGQPSVCVVKDGRRNCMSRQKDMKTCQIIQEANVRFHNMESQLAGDQRWLWVLPFVSIPLRLQFFSFYSHSNIQLSRGHILPQFRNWHWIGCWFVFIFFSPSLVCPMLGSSFIWVDVIDLPSAGHVHWVLFTAVMMN